MEILHLIRHSSDGLIQIYVMFDSDLDVVKNTEKNT